MATMKWARLYPSSLERTLHAVWATRVCTLVQTRDLTAVLTEKTYAHRSTNRFSVPDGIAGAYGGSDSEKGVGGIMGPPKQ